MIYKTNNIEVFVLHDSSIYYVGGVLNDSRLLVNHFPSSLFAVSVEKQIIFSSDLCVSDTILHHT